ncbi:MAG: nuclear transport factor 2 family protein [Algoriphagus sp.]|nr:nuclear transport factor 2 family protein [Algoriphagus sp.]
MRILLLLCFLTSVHLAKAQVQENSSLLQELKTQDSIFFERGFNRCDLGYLKNQVADDLRFYHDQGGFQDKIKFLENTANNICGSGDKKPIRKVDAESLEVFPMNSDGILYGAIQTGIHHFYLRETGKEDLWTSSAKFTHLWIRDLEGWKLKEVLSYDHQSNSPPLSHRD